MDIAISYKLLKKSDYKGVKRYVETIFLFFFWVGGGGEAVSRKRKTVKKNKVSTNTLYQ